jgi:hypothetical protein
VIARPLELPPYGLPGLDAWLQALPVERETACPGCGECGGVGLCEACAEEREEER